MKMNEENYKQNLLIRRFIYKLLLSTALVLYSLRIFSNGARKQRSCKQTSVDNFEENTNERKVSILL